MDALFDEIDSLEAILMDDVNITKNPDTGFPELIETTIFPTVEDTESQYICVTLQVIPKPGYPDISPNFHLIKPRGLDDGRLNEIKNACIQKLSDSLGYPVVFDLIDVIREHLTGSNLPSGQCVICLYGFKDGDDFTKTECFHYLHSYCLLRHLTASKKNYQEEQDKLPAWLRKTSKPFQATCPVCRESISDNSENLKNSNPPLEVENAPEFHLTKELSELQNKMQNLYLKQKNRGAIIDPKADESSVLLLGPELEEPIRNSSAIDVKNFACVTNSSSTIGKENGIEQSNAQSQSVNRRSNNTNQQRGSNQRQSNNNNINQGNNSDEDSSSNNSHYNGGGGKHHRRGHHFYPHRSRRQQIHHLSSNNDSSHSSSPSSSSHQKKDNSQEQQQQKANVRNSHGNSTR